MQQKNKNASILIWVFFLVSLLSISFIYISIKIKKSLKENNQKLETLKIQQEKENFLQNINSKTKKIGDNILSIKNYSSFEYPLKKDEIFELEFIETGSINLELLNSGIISYAFNTEDFGKNILPTYNTGTTSTGFLVTPGTKLKIKNFSGYSKIKIGASKKVTYKLNILPKTEVFKKSGKVTLSVGSKGGKIKYYINGILIGNIAGNSNVKYVNKSFFIKSGDNLKIEKISGSSSKKVIISGDYNLSDLVKNNSYKIYKKNWGKETIIEKGKIK